MKKYLLNMHIEEFRTTLFRQTMFAEFEMLTHEAVERGEVLTAEWLCEKYAELNRLYFGDNVVCDPKSPMNGLAYRISTARFMFINMLPDIPLQQLFQI